MALYKLVEWEQNGYHDSYFKAAMYDSDADAIIGVETGATAYAGGRGLPEPAPEGEVAVKAYRRLERHIREVLLRQAVAVHETPEPDDLNQGCQLVLTEQHRTAKRNTVKCPKCGGSGSWTNPRNSSDKRDCFGCQGRGKKEEKQKGKGSTFVIPAGTVVVVESWKSHGQFYDKGYNQPNRGNTSVFGRLLDGTPVNVSLNKCRKVGATPVEDSFRVKAHQLACEGQFQAATGLKCAWLSKRFVECPAEFRDAEPLPLDID